MQLAKLLLSCLLSILIVVTGGPFQMYFEARAQVDDGAEANLSEQEVQERETLAKEQQIEELRRTILQPELGGADLDPFEIMRQRVLDDRMDRLDAIQEKMSIEDYLERLSYHQRTIVELNDLEAKVRAKLAPLTADSEKFTELNLVLEDIISRRKLAAMEIEDLRQFDPRDGKSLPVDFMIDRQITARHYWGHRMTLRIENQGQTVLDIKQSDFTTSLSPRFSSANPLEGLADGRELTFSLLDPKGRVLNQFMIPVDAAFFYGQFLVFVEKADLQRTQGHVPIRFIDLNYFRPNIGNAPLPVYTFPLNINQAPESIAIQDGYLKVGGQKLSYQQFAMLAQVQQLVFNVNVALADPRTYENVQPLIDEIMDFFKKSMANQDELFKLRLEKAISATDFVSTLTDSLSTRPNVNPDEIKKLIAEALKDGKITEAEYQGFQKFLDADDGLKDANNAINDGRKLTTRIKLLFQYLTQPRPEGAPKLFESLSIVALGTAEERARLTDLPRNTLLSKMVKYGAATGGIMLAGSFLPEPYAINIYKTMDMVSAVSAHFQGYLNHIDYGRAYGELAKDAFLTSTTGITYFFQSYIADGVWPKFLYGLGSVLLVPLQVFGSIHLTMNSYKLLKATLELRRLSNGEIGFLRAFKKAAAADQKAYWDSLADAEKRVSGSDVSSISEEEKALLDDHIDRIRHGRESLKVLEREVERGRLSHLKGESRFLSMITGFTRLFKFGKKTEATIGAAAQELQMKDAETFRKAVSNTFLSYSSLRTTFKANATIWNYLFVTRSYVFSPAKWLMFFIYPNYFRVTIGTREGRQHFPSRYNRGLEMWPQKLERLISKQVQKSGLRESNVAQKLFISAEGLNNLKAFESYVGNMEAVAMEIAKKQAQKALFESVRDPERLMILFDSSQRPGQVSTGIQNLHDRKIKELTNTERIYYRAYFTRTFDVVMQGFVSQLHNIDKGLEMDPEAFARMFVNGLRDGTITPVDVTDEKISQLEAEIEKIIDFSLVRAWAERASQSAKGFADRLNVQFRHKLLESIHPQNPQIRRFLTAEAKVQDPRAMERAMRMEVSSLFTSIPLGIMSTLVLYAGVDTGLIMPFDPEGLDTETHLRYMSRYLFYNGFIPGLIIGLLANTWMKVQEDARIDELGGFDKAIKFGDGQRGFWRYYFKNFFKNPDNKWSSNHIYYLKLITANIPAAAVTILVSNLYGLGRIDVGTFIAGYIMVYVTFLEGFQLKIAQSFELASSWVYNKIPRKLRASPEAQRYISQNLQKKKFSFTLLEHVFGILVVDNVAGTMMTLKDNVKYGTRAFLRLLFGGDTPTQLIVNFADKIMEAFKGVPGIRGGMDIFKSLFSHNYDAFERFPERLGPVPDGVERFVENANLPRHALGEFIGKLGAMVATLGSFTTLPYIFTDYLQRRREARLQRQGEEIVARQGGHLNLDSRNRVSEWVGKTMSWLGRGWSVVPVVGTKAVEVRRDQKVLEATIENAALQGMTLRCNQIFIK